MWECAGGEASCAATGAALHPLPWTLLFPYPVLLLHPCTRDMEPRGGGSGRSIIPGLIGWDRLSSVHVYTCVCMCKYVRGCWGSSPHPLSCASQPALLLRTQLLPQSSLPARTFGALPSMGTASLLGFCLAGLGTSISQSWCCWVFPLVADCQLPSLHELTEPLEPHMALKKGPGWSLYGDDTGLL